MPTPHVFDTRDELIERLRSRALSDRARHFFSARCESVEEVVHTGVGGNTFRAFHHVDKPSVAFRTWATNYLKSNLPDILDCENPAGFALQVHKATQALEEFWEDHAKKEMGYGRGAKLLNLVIKKLGCLDGISEVQRSRLISFMHVPLDKYTIQGLRYVAPDLRICSHASMGFITSSDHYWVFQGVATGIAADAGVPAIHYDVLAWDMAH